MVRHIKWANCPIPAPLIRSREGKGEGASQEWMGLKGEIFWRMSIKFLISGRQ